MIFFSDPSQYPDWAGTSDNGLLSDLAPPVFSSFTLKQSRNYKLKVGDNFEASRSSFCVQPWNTENGSNFRFRGLPSTIFDNTQMPDHYSQNVLKGIKLKLWTSSFHWYLVIWNWPRGFRAIASQSEAVFPKLQKCAYFATSEVVISGNFFSDCCHTKMSRDKDMKPTANDHKFSKFL